MTLFKVPCLPSPFSKDTDADLLFFMAMKDDDPSAAEQAWAEFYSRHVGYLYKACQWTFGSTLGEPAIEDLVHNTFVRVYEKAGTFRVSEQTGDPNLEPAHVRAWLGRIAENLLRDSYRRTCQVDLATDDDLEREDGKRPKQSVDAPERIELIAEAFQTLSDKEQDILRLTALWYCPGKELRIPAEELRKLASDYGTTAVTIRQNRRRAMQKVRTYVEAKEKQRESKAHG